MKLTESTNDQLMALAAHRYCLGRSSYIVGACHEWLKATWDQFTQETRNTMLRDTIDALGRSEAGMDMDARGWADVVRWAWALTTYSDRDWVEFSCSSHGREWFDAHLREGQP